MNKIASTLIMTSLVLLSSISLGLIVANAQGPVQYIGEDRDTQGNWVGVYGHYAYILPKAPSAHVEYPIGPGTPMSTSPYYDYVGGDGWPVEYMIAGPAIPADVRALETPDETQRRATCYWGDSTIELVIPEGDYRLALYLLDWDSTARTENITVTDASGYVKVTVSGFHDGKYVFFNVTGGTVTISLKKVSGANAVISGIFLDSIEAFDSIAYVGEDSATQGNWVENYGAEWYLLCAMDSIYTRSNTQPEDPTYDVTGGTLTVNYTVTNGNYWAWTNYYPAEDTTAPCYSYIWETPTEDARACWYTEEQEFTGYPTMEDAYEREAACWDSHTHPYFTVDLSIPNGTFYLSLYALDYDTYARSETIEIFDNEGTLLASVAVRDFHDGVYERFLVEGPIDLVIKVTKTSGANSVLSGIFLDEVVTTGSISGIKFFDADKDGVFNVTAGDWPIEGWNITLLDNQGNIIALTLTDENGYYIFEGLEPGTYIVREVLKEGWTCTTSEEQIVTLTGGTIGAAGVLSGSVSVPLIAGQFIEVGSVDIYFNGTHLFVTYSMTDDYYLTETQLYVGDEPPTTSAPGQYPFKHENIYTQTDQYIISLDDLELGTWPEILYIAAHATVYCPSWPENGAETETAWAGVPPGEETAWATTPGWTPFDQGWGGYFPYAPAVLAVESVTDVNFGNWAPIAYGPAGLTIGFWKTNVGKNLGYIPGKPQLRSEQIEVFLSAINETYGGNYPFLYNLTLDDAYRILSISDASDMRLKAEAQILGLLLTAQYKEYADEHVYLPDIGQGSYYSGNMSGAIDYILGLYDEGNYEAAKNLADALNNMPEEGYIWVELIED